MKIKQLPSVEEDFDVRRTLPFTIGYAQRHPYEMESTVADRINKGVNFSIQNTVTQDRDQAYTSSIAGIEGMRSVFDGCELADHDKSYLAALTDIIENVVKPLYGKGTCYTLDENKPDTCPSNCSVHKDYSDSPFADRV